MAPGSQRIHEISISDEDDPINPLAFSDRKKWTMTIFPALTTFTVTFCSSVFSSTISVTSKEFDTSETVMILGISLFVLGFAIGPIFWGPLSELKGRRLPLFTGFFVFAAMQIPIALARNLTTVLVCRFLAGGFGASPIVLVSAIYADIWEPAERGIATSFYAATVYAGPTLGPIIGALLTESQLGWRWTAWFTLIMAAVSGLATLLVLPETYMPVLRQQAAQKRFSLGQSAENATASPPGPVTAGFRTFAQKYATKPVLLLVFEPMVGFLYHGIALKLPTDSF